MHSRTSEVTHTPAPLTSLITISLHCMPIQSIAPCQGYIGQVLGVHYQGASNMNAAACLPVLPLLQKGAHRLHWLPWPRQPLTTWNPDNTKTAVVWSPTCDIWHQQPPECAAHRYIPGSHHCVVPSTAAQPSPSSAGIATAGVLAVLCPHVAAAWDTPSTQRAHTPLTF